MSDNVYLSWAIVGVGIITMAANCIMILCRNLTCSIYVYINYDVIAITIMY